MTAPRGVVAVTGSSGYLGGCLLRHLEEYGDYDRLVAIDARPLPFPVHNVAAYRRDVSQPVHDIFIDDGVAAVVHFAFSLPRGSREVSDVGQANRNALDGVLKSCEEARVRHIVYVSSHTVYGARPGNPIPLTTEAPWREPPDLFYAQENARAEQRLTEFAENHRDIRVTVLRSCKVLGPIAGFFLPPETFPRWMLGVEGFDPPLQFLHEEDLARVLSILLEREIAGTFNIAGDGLVFYKELAGIIGSRILWLPPVLAYPLAKFVRDPHFQMEPGRAGLNLLRYPVVMSTGKLRQATGYRYWHTSQEALVSYANANLY